MWITASYYLPYVDDPIKPNKSMAEIRGGSRIFSRGAYFQKNFENLVYFFEVDQIDFPSSLKALQRPRFRQNFCAEGKMWKKHDNKDVIKPFLENFDQKMAFLWRALPLKISIYWHRRRL